MFALTTESPPAARGPTLAVGSHSFDGRPDAGSGSALLEASPIEGLREVHDVDRVRDR